MENGKAVGSQVVGASVNFSPEFSAGEPNLNLLRRIAESGGGRVLDPTKPDNNPFTHDRTKTYQPRDLWEWLLKLAVILFVLDVGVRRIQLDGEEWLKATATLRRWVFFWQGAARPPEAEESLASLLARRGEVRATKTAAGDEARPELFRPQQPGAPVELPGSPLPEATPRPVAAPKDEPKTDETGKPENTTSRLLEAKRRAQKRRDG
jgi:Ca-activated chloride channel homolog